MKTYCVEWTFYGKTFKNFSVVQAVNEDWAILAVMAEHPTRCITPVKVWTNEND